MSEELFRSNERLLPLAALLTAIDRPGSYCASGRLVCPMPQLSVADAGVVPFPVPEGVLNALVEQAERAPFGRGEETVLDRSVRDTWQISPERVSIGGKGWSDTFQQILSAVGEGLGCPAGSISAELHKLLLYERGGHFAPHRDTEKTSGMVATLVVSLPVAGEGGELVVRHKDREMRIDMRTEDPSELVYAAFYADCEHEVRPVVEGHRLVLVFNLVRTDGAFGTAPDFGGVAGDIADWLTGYAAAVRACEPRPLPSPSWDLRSYSEFDREDAEEGEDPPPEKLVWLLEHEYSEGGLSFSALKNLDEAMAQSVVEAAARARCEVYGAILRIEQGGGVADEWDPYGDPTIATLDEETLFDDSRWLEGWVALDGKRPKFGEVPIAPGELIPSPHLDDIEPDDAEFVPPTGNDGVSLEQRYRLAALVVWPEDRSVDVLGRGGVKNAVNYLAYVRQQVARQPDIRERRRQQAERLVSLWPSPRPHEIPEDWSKPSSAFIAELVHLGDLGLMERFLVDSILPNYSEDVNDALCDAVVAIGPERAASLLAPVVNAGFGLQPNSVIGLVSGINRATHGGMQWDDTLRVLVRMLFDGLNHLEGCAVAGNDASPEGGTLSGQSVQGLFGLFHRLDMGRVAHFAAEALVGPGDRVDPYRDLPSALEALEQTAPGLRKALAVLWCHSAGRLLERSGDPPREPRNWVIRAKIPLPSKEKESDRSTTRNWSQTECCRQLQKFCDSAEETTCRFPARKEIRRSLKAMIGQMRLDIDCRTEARGNPHNLVCVKNRASYQRRLTQYAADVEFMERLADQETAARSERALRDELCRAIDRGQRFQV